MMIIVAVLVIVAATLWLWKPAWLSKASREKAASRLTQTTARVTETTKETVAKTGERLGPVLSGVEGKVRLPFRRGKDLATQFKEWVGQAELAKRTAVYKALPADAAGFTAWLQGLADEDLGGFVKELAAFCKGLGFELAWLVDPKVEGAMKQAVEEAVGLYCLAAWKGRDVRPFVAYRAWQSAPGKKENQAFAQRLYSKLVGAGLATSTPDLLLAPEKERQAYVAEAIEAAAAQDPKAFVGLLRDVAGVAAVVEAKEEAPAKGTKKHGAPPAKEVASAAVAEVPA
jgi:hypothetical protein